MKQLKRITWVILILLLSLVQVAFSQESLIAVRVVRWVRPHILVGEVLQKEVEQRVRIRLAGIVPTLGNEPLYERALQRVKELTREKELAFDFALGHGPEEKVWVGYLYISSSGNEEPILVNAELLREGLVTLDEGDVGRNLLGYFIEAQEEAQEKKVGFWTVATPRAKRKSNECPSCEIR